MSQICRFRYFLMIIGIQTIFLTGKAEQAHQVKGADKAAEDTRTKEVPMRFSYSVEDSLDRSNHFRQEQRDANGVVRGSYGFQNPEGAFRLVHYIADDKGFRAHVTSNEHGLGQQNPASVNINRFARRPSIQDEKTFMRNPFLSHQKGYNKVESQSLENQDYPHPHSFAPAQQRRRFSGRFILPATKD
ncbi:uncharacterized protein LOC118192669 [Stegodyphus dumicola]|uniref:uncharacterized protein LOC118192669 n=1 Tax=Stegodyphus dumicola TaxID=202533 RepID=UPI0015AE99C6|nr:uncharacterized protein LOC118192669 [Stegodyphus dumicola]